MTTAILIIVAGLMTSAINSYNDLMTTASTVLMDGIQQTFWDSMVIFSQAAFSTICNIIIAICTLVELAQVAAKVDIIKFENAIKIGVKMALARASMEIAPDFLRACYNQVALTITSLQGSFEPPSLGLTFVATLTSMITSVDGLGGAISMLVISLLLILAIRVCGFLVVTLAYVRQFEILMYLLVSPLPCAFFPYGEGINRVTVRFFKGFAAVCLQGLMMYMCLRLFGSMVNQLFTNQVIGILNLFTGNQISATVAVTDICWQMILYAVLLILAVAKCGSWAKSILDVA